MSDERRRLELELLLKRTIPGTLSCAEEPDLLNHLTAMGLDPRRHSDLTATLHSLLEPLPAERSPTPQQAPQQVPESIADTASSYLAEFSVDGVLEDDADEAAMQSSSIVDLEDGLDDADRSPVINLVDRILMQALQLGASDIHVEPQQAGLQLRFRQDGVLQTTIEPLPSRLVLSQGGILGRGAPD